MNNPKETDKGKIARHAIQAAVDAAEALAIPIIQVPSFLDGEIKNDEDFENTAECLSYACDLVDNKPIIIGMENLLSIEESKKMLRAVNHPKLKIFFDLQNYHLFKGYNTQDMLRELGSQICEIHAKDGKGYMSGALLGEGDAGFFESVELLRSMSYSGWIHLENYYDHQPLSDSGEDPFQLAIKDLHILKSAFSR
jgi:sugar phosphate isomerase/epimerase